MRGLDLRAVPMRCAFCAVRCVTSSRPSLIQEDPVDTRNLKETLLLLPWFYSYSVLCLSLFCSSCFCGGTGGWTCPINRVINRLFNTVECHPVLLRWRQRLTSAGILRDPPKFHLMALFSFLLPADSNRAMFYVCRAQYEESCLCHRDAPLCFLATVPRRPRNRQKTHPHWMCNTSLHPKKKISHNKMLLFASQWRRFETCPFNVWTLPRVSYIWAKQQHKALNFQRLHWQNKLGSVYIYFIIPSWL